MLSGHIHDLFVLSELQSREYIISGETESLESFRKTIVKQNEAFVELKKKFCKDVEDLKLLSIFRTQIIEGIGFYSKRISERKTSLENGVQNLINKKEREEIRLMNRVINSIASIEHKQNGHLQKRHKEIDIQEEHLVFSFFFLNLITIFVILMGAVLIIRYNRKNGASETEVKELLRQEKERLKSLLKISELDYASKDIVKTALEEAILLTNSNIGYVYLFDRVNKSFTLDSSFSRTGIVIRDADNKKSYHLDESTWLSDVLIKQEAIRIKQFDACFPLKNCIPGNQASSSNYLGLPIFWDREIVAIVALGIKDGDYTEADIQHLNLLMNTAWKILERKKSEEEVMNSLLLLDQIFEIAPFGMRTINLDKTVIHVNGKYLSYNNLTGQEIVGNKCSDYFCAKDCATEDCSIKRILSGEECFKSEIRLPKRTSENEFHYYDLIVVPIKDHRNKITGFLEIYMDVTEKIEKERLLFENGEKLRIIFENSSIGINLADSENKLITFNPRFAEILGYKQDELENKNIFDYTYELDTKKENEFIRELILGKTESFQIEKRFIKKIAYLL